MIKIEQNAKLLSATSKPYDVNGNKGTSHKVRLSITDEIFILNSNADQISELASFVGKEGKVSFKLESPKESVKLTLVDFLPSK